jgi:hypothetical protein
MEKRVKKLVVSRETLRQLNLEEARKVVGGISNTISPCTVACNTRLHTCLC